MKKINSFEGNAIGQIGEKFIKELCREFSIAFDDSKNEVIHDEYDIIINNKKIEFEIIKEEKIYENIKAIFIYFQSKGCSIQISNGLSYRVI